MTTQEVHSKSAPIDSWKGDWERCAKTACVGGIASVALGSLAAAGGIALCIVATPVTLAIGIAIMLLTCPLFWFGYNCLMVKCNISKILEQAEEYGACSPSDEQMRAKAAVAKNTILFGCVLDMAAEEMRAGIHSKMFNFF